MGILEWLIVPGPQRDALLAGRDIRSVISLLFWLGLFGIGIA
jgi:hypothetical protein